jgi:hypothetical protein
MRNVFLGVVAVAALAVSGVASAQSGHFVTGGANAPECIVNPDYTVTCEGKVAGLGGTTFEITLEVDASATWDCINPNGNPGNSTPGQANNLTAEGTSGEQLTPQNGQFEFTITTGGLNLGKLCPSPKWTVANFTVTFSDAILTLYEDGVESDQITVAF